MAMSAEQRLGALIFGLLLCTGEVLAAEEEAPDVELLEYLGMWEESDEDWLILNEAVAADKEERIDPVPEGEESVEKDDES